MAKEKLIPTTIIAGFLGAGKTTLLNHILNGDHGLKIAVMVNDFGAIDIDSQLIVSIEDNVMSLANGCICCTVQSDLIEQLEGLLQKRGSAAPEYILIEASGVSDPGKIAHTLRYPQFTNRISIDGIITILDCSNINDLDEDATTLAMSQLNVADIILLSKCDLIDNSTLEAIKQKWLYPKARIMESNHGDVPLGLLLGVGSFNPDNLLRESHSSSHDHHNHDHGDQFATWHWQSEGCLNLGRLRAAFEALPTGIYRAKGIFNVEEVPDHQCIVQMVGSRIEFSKGDNWGDNPASNQVVVIGTSALKSEISIEKIFDDTACNT